MNATLALHSSAVKAWLGSALLLTLAIFFTSGASNASGEEKAGAELLRKSLKDVVTNVSTLLKKRGFDTVSVGDFVGPPQFSGGVSPGIKKILGEEFQKLGIRSVKVGATMGVRGNYAFIDDSVRLEVDLIGPDGGVLASLNAAATPPISVEARLSPDALFNVINLRDTIPAEPIIAVKSGKFNVDTQLRDNDATTLFGVTRDFPKPDNTPLEEVVLQSFQSPTAFVEKRTKLRASDASPFLFELLVKGVPQKISSEEGQPYVHLDRGEAFTLRFSNRSGYDVSVAFLMDGINSFAFSKVRKADGEPFSRDVVKKGDFMALRGWHKNHDLVRAFTITDFSNSASALIGTQESVGAITVIVRATWRAGEHPPPLEFPEPTAGHPDLEMASGSAGMSSGGSSAMMMDSRLAVGIGNEVESKSVEDAQGRKVGRVRTVMTLRYDKPETLVDWETLRFVGKRRQ